MIEADFLVLGGGMAGVSVAAELAQRARVVLLEREPTLAFHATGRSAALYTATYGPPQIRALTQASRAFLEAPPEGFADAPLMKPRGVLLLVGAERPQRLDELRAEHGDGLGRLMGPEDCRSLIPILRDERIAGGYLETGAADLDVDAIHQGYLRQARSRGATIVTEAGEVNIARWDGVWVATFHGGAVRARRVVNAAGAWTEELSRALGARPMGLVPLRRTALLVDPPPGVEIADWPAVIDAEEQFYFKPDAGKVLLSPADETPSDPCDAQPDELAIAIAVDRVQQVADLPVRRVNHAWAGLRTFAPDRLPVVGYDPEVEGLFWLAGQGGYGIQTAPALARMAAALALEEPPPSDLLAFGVDPSALAPLRSRVSAHSTAYAKSA